MTVKGCVPEKNFIKEDNPKKTSQKAYILKIYLKLMKE